MKREYANLPLFSEHARKGDPQGSHDRAASLNKSIKLTEQIMRVLHAVRLCEGQTARSIGIYMAKALDNPDLIEHPHKVAKRLYDAGYVTRKGCPFELTITEAGESALREVSK